MMMMWILHTSIYRRAMDADGLGSAGTCCWGWSCWCWCWCVLFLLISAKSFHISAYLINYILRVTGFFYVEAALPNMHGFLWSISRWWIGHRVRLTFPRSRSLGTAHTGTGQKKTTIYVQSIDLLHVTCKSAASGKQRPCKTIDLRFRLNPFTYPHI